LKRIRRAVAFGAETAIEAPPALIKHPEDELAKDCDKPDTGTVTQGEVASSLLAHPSNGTKNGAPSLSNQTQKSKARNAR